MEVVASKNANGNLRVYHRHKCIYAKRIKKENKIYLDTNHLSSKKYCPCKYCGGMQGYAKIHKYKLYDWQEKYNMNFVFSNEVNSIYVQTDIGFWKVYWSGDISKYLLYHRNTFDANLSERDAIRGKFHRQCDVKETESMTSIIDYIYAHDKAKAIMEVDYRLLPHKTKKEKKYYRKAKRKFEIKERINTQNRLNNLFSMLENENKDFIKLSFC